MVRQITFTCAILTAALAARPAQPASAAVIPADESWTENKNVDGQFFWGNYEGTQTSIAVDTTDKTTGTGSIKFAGINNPANYPDGPAITFVTDGHPDITSYAGGTFSYDFKFDGPATYLSSQLYIYSGDTVAGAKLQSINGIATNLQTGWNHVVVNLPAAWDTSGGFAPGNIVEIRFRLIFHTAAGYDHTARNVWFDNMKLTSVPEPASGGLILLGALALPMWRRRRA
jgi:MYXO-CTERM domain-containing protein